ncbi:MAG: glycosyltransferase family 39 protein [Candidatus Omnitrophica bacterium]|nr:glycosyltransferase family 39 protein [Candidatus Omnitrophota bacterium]
MLFGIGLIGIATLIIALIAPPNTYDSMTYHMPRVMHWMQNHSVANYPTNEVRQLWISPFTEFCILNFQILTHSDRFANLIQWLGFMGSTVVGSLIAALLGANRKQQIFAAFLIATIPMAILQASSTQTDVFAGFWILSSIYYLIKLHEKFSWPTCLLLWISFGLAFLTKGTAIIFTLPFISLYLLRLSLHNSNPKPRVVQGKNIFIAGITGILIFLLINMGFFIRNVQLGGHPISPVDSAKYVSNTSHSLPIILSNLSKNTAMNLWTPLPKLNRSIENFIEQFHKLINLKSTDDRNTFGEYKFTISEMTHHEDYAPNPLPLIYFAVTLLTLLLIWKKIQLNKYALFLYALSLLSAWILFSVVLKWQPWGTRLQVPFFFLAAPLTALVIGQFNRYVLSVFMLTAFIYAIPLTFQNSSRRLISSHGTIFQIPRVNQYFNNNPNLGNSYLTMTQVIDQMNVKNLGIIESGETWEYPLQALLKTHPRVEQIEIDPPAPKNYILGSFKPEVILTVKQHLNDFEIKIQETRFVKFQQISPLALFVPDPTGQMKIKILYRNIVNSLQMAASAPGFPALPQERANAAYFLEFQINQAQANPAAELNAIWPDLGNNYTQLFLLGLELQYKGLTENNPAIFEYGKNKLQEWQNLLGKNQDAIQKKFSAALNPV